jgi:hypothetical protein
MLNKLRRNNRRCILPENGYSCLKGLRRGNTKINMHKLGKKRSLVGSWEGPYEFGLGWKGISRTR